METVGSKVDKAIEGIKGVILKEKYKGYIEGIPQNEGYTLMVGCTKELIEIIEGGGEELVRVVRVADGYLLPIGEDKWFKLIGERNDAQGIVIYDGTNSTRIILDKLLKTSDRSELEVIIIRGKDGVLQRLNAEKETV